MSDLISLACANEPNQFKLLFHFLLHLAVLHQAISDTDFSRMHGLPPVPCPGVSPADSEPARLIGRLEPAFASLK